MSTRAAAKSTSGAPPSRGSCSATCDCHAAPPSLHVTLGAGQAVGTSTGHAPGDSSTPTTFESTPGPHSAHPHATAHVTTAPAGSASESLSAHTLARDRRTRGSLPRLPALRARRVRRQPAAVVAAGWAPPPRAPHSPPRERAALNHPQQHARGEQGVGGEPERDYSERVCERSSAGAHRPHPARHQSVRRPWSRPLESSNHAEEGRSGCDGANHPTARWTCRPMGTPDRRVREVPMWRTSVNQGPGLTYRVDNPVRPEPPLAMHPLDVVASNLHPIAFHGVCTPPRHRPRHHRPREQREREFECPHLGA